MKNTTFDPAKIKTPWVVTLVGPPLSGKTTFLKKFFKGSKYVHLSSDDLVMELYDDGSGDFNKAFKAADFKKIDKKIDQLFKKAVKDNENVVVDFTNLVKKRRISNNNYFPAEYIRVAIVFPQLTVKEYDERNEKRTIEDKKTIFSGVQSAFLNMWEEVSTGEGFHQIIKLDKKFEIVSVEEGTGEITEKPRKKNEVRFIADYSVAWRKDLADAVVFDVDGTTCHMNGKRGPFDWKKVGVDDLDKVVARQMKMHKKFGDKILIVSGRDGSCREETEAYFKLHGLEYDALFMRKPGDFRKDSLVKREIYETELKGKYNIIVVYDDRQQVVDTWRSIGLKCFQVEPGNF